MTDQLTQMGTQSDNLQPNGDTVLRLLIRESVDRELLNQLAPLRTQVQVLDGMLKQLNRDYAVLSSNFGDLEEIVRGNPKQGLLGVLDQLKQAQTLIGDLHTEFRQGLNRIESAVAVKIEGMQKQLDAADDKRQAMINQLKGARYAFIGLGVITGLAQYKELAALLQAIFS